jgi:flagellar basal body-associated protein FliL
MVKIYILMFVVLLIGGISASGYKIWTDMQEQVRTLSVQKEVLENAKNVQDQTINSLQTENNNVQLQLKVTYEDLDQARRNTDLLEEKLEKNDIGLLAERKPALVENIINNASAKAFRCFELMSGSDLTDAERNANDAKKFNSECPWMYERLIPN